MTSWRSLIFKITNPETEQLKVIISLLEGSDLKQYATYHRIMGKVWGILHAKVPLRSFVWLSLGSEGRTSLLVGSQAGSTCLEEGKTFLNIS